LKKFLFILFIICSTTLQAQNPDIKRTWHWYFGNHAGLDFSSGTPMADTNGQMIVWKGSATMSDTAGNLLFYTNGIQVWNKNHQIMPNGNFLINSYSPVAPTQILAVPKPGSSNLYYIFYTQFGTQLLAYVELVYAIVDMNQDGGLGDVVSQQNHILNGVNEKITAIPKNKSSDIWIVTMKFHTNSFYTYLLTNSGIDTIPQGIYNLGKVDNIGDGYLKPSLDGTKIAAGFDDSGNDGKLELMNFDNSTGILSDPLVFPSCKCDCYGLQFSSDGNKLYSAVLYYGLTGNSAGNALYQYNLAMGDSASIINSKIVLDSIFVNPNDTVNPDPVYGFCYVLQLASDGKIYGPKYQTPKICAISYPNLLGTACNYIDSAVYLNSRTCEIGFPEFLSSYFYTDTSTAISENFNQNKIIKVYPNPIISNAIIEILDYNKNIKHINIEVYDIIGKKYNIDYSVISDNGKTLRLSITTGNLSSGLYLLKATINKETYSQKIILTN